MQITINDNMGESVKEYFSITMKYFEVWFIKVWRPEEKPFYKIGIKLGKDNYYEKSFKY